ncbi:hypothetical protein [Capnocytophaga stomatis]|uniref:Uncharacterized protein n=1 Tax=Capnocytophaga stomatis TaxID=1848904 RepID=A0A250FTZ9_9FLAO|nr:hypothetical protein [Capnocytophaga stomatis]ATA88501.1 hypothetical protein CGC58_01365 [Capnocytophaga stomatis]
MKEDCIYFIGIALYLLVLAGCIVLFRKKNITSLRFLLLSALFLLMLNIIYWVAIRIFTNSYEGVLLVYAAMVLNVIAIPTIVILSIIKHKISKK